MRANLAPLSLLLFLFTIVTDASNDSQFLVVAPRKFIAGQHEKIWISYFDTNSSEKPYFNVNLLDPDSGKVLFYVNYKYDQKTAYNIALQVPNIPLGRARLEVVVTNGNKTEKRSAEVEIEHNAAVTFIETDRPYYKPGELVRMRFLLLQHELRPVTTGIHKVWVENPSDVRMAQWQNLQTSNGLAQVEMQLSEEPVQGIWKIKLQPNNVSGVETKTFEVKEYVLPKFEVIITPPDYVTQNSEELVWKVCAKYSYGKPVQGSVTFNISFEVPRFHWEVVKNDVEVISQVEMLTAKDGGCHAFTISTDILAAQNKKHAVSISAKAYVKEEGTGEVQEMFHVSEIHRDVVELQFTHTPPYFRPFLPYAGKLRVTYRNGKPVEGQEVKFVLKVKKTSHSPWAYSWNLPHQDTKNFTSDANGYIDFIIPPQLSDVHTIVIEASITSPTQNFYQSFEAKQWYSPSDSYIQIMDDSAFALECNTEHSMDIIFTYNKSSTAKSLKFIYLIQSKGDIIVQFTKDIPVRDSKFRQELRTSKQNMTLGKVPNNSKLMSAGKWTLKIEVTPKMSPASQLLLYYVRDDGEVVAASQKLIIQECLQHKVKAQFLQQHPVQPGAKVSFVLGPSSRSYCAISGIDKAVTFLNGDNSLSRQKVFQSIQRFDIGPAPPDEDDYQPCYRDFPTDRGLPIPLPLLVQRNRRYIARPFTTGFGNTKRAFGDAGMVVLTNLEVNYSPCSSSDPQKKSPCNPCPLAHDNSHFMPVARRGKLARTHFASAMDADFVDLMAVPMVASITSDAENSYDPSAIESPIVEIRSLFPETWLWNLEQFDKPEERQMELETPHSITDWIVNAVCVSVEHGLGIAPPTTLKVFKPYFMDYTIPYSVKRGEILPLKVSLFNYLNHGLPIRLTFGEFTGGSLLNENSYSTCLSEHSSIVHEFRLQPTELGEHNITVTANVDPDFPSECGPDLLINARDGLVKTIIVKPEGYPEEITNSVFICLSDEDAHIDWGLEVPDNIVNDSARAFVSVVGDIMGPSLENLDGLVRLPMGCGEQNMILFVPNIVVLDYLSSSGQVNPELRKNALSHMKKGYQRELTYRHKDGSYSAFGESDPEGSMWLTAFVVKSFAQAKKYIFIDEIDLFRSVSWITRKQMENGCFPAIGQVFHKDMKGGLGASSSSTALTAYVLISLMETGLVIDNNVISNGVFCLLGEKDPDLYTLALTTYALALINEKQNFAAARNQTDAYIEQLMSHAINDNNGMRFEKEGSNSLALSVEITAYVILTLARLGDEDKLLHALNAVKWISKNRNSNGGFVSTQDTVVALEALAKYAVSVPKKDISMKLHVNTTEGWLHTFSLNQEDRMVLQQRTISAVPTNLKFHASGKGCALVQSNLRYNVKDAPVSDAFNLNTSITPVTDGVCSQLLFEANVVYMLVDEASNMAVMEVDLLSGYVPVKTSLDLLKSDIKLNLKRWEEHNGQIHLYFDSVASEGINLNFLIEQAVEVESPQPAQVRVYDYYTPEQTVSTSYGLENVRCRIEFLPEPMAVPQPFVLKSLPVLTSNFAADNTEAADEPSSTDNSKDPLDNFSNVDHELEFPEGNEGVEPVYAPAPNSLSHMHARHVDETSTSETVSSCPHCYDDVPQNFTDLYCSSSSVFKLSALSMDNAKLLTDMSPSNKRLTRMNKNVALLLDNHCSCEVLNQSGTHVLILTTSNSDESIPLVDRSSITLDQNSHIIRVASSDKKIAFTLIQQSRKQCKI